MNEVILHKHLEESRGAQSSDKWIERVSVVFEVSDWHPFHEAFDQDRVSGFFFKGLRKSDAFVSIEVPVEYLEVVLLNVEVNLIDEGLFERVFADGNFVGLGEES